MKTEGAVSTFEDLKDGANQAAEHVKSFAAKAGNQISSAYESTRRGIRRIKTTADDAIEEARHEIKEHPLAIVAGAALGAFAVGVLTGWIIRSRRSS